MAELKHSDFMKGIEPLLREYVPKKWQKFRLGETRWFFQVYFDGRERRIHYEVSRPSARQGRMLEIGLHFESRNKQLNRQLLEAIRRYILEIREQLGDQVVAEQWDRGWTKVYEAYPSPALTDEAQDFAAQRLAQFIATVQPIYKHIRGEL